MNWQPELDELREREAMARRLGGPDKVEPPARCRQADRSASESTALVDRGSFHEIGAIAGHAAYDDAGPLTTLMPSNCVMGRGPDRRPPGGRRRRRFHGARRLGGRDDPREAADGRADGARSAAADHPHHRGLGRRRLGQDDRDDGPRQSAGPGRVKTCAYQLHDDESRPRAGRGARAGLGRRARRRAHGGQPLLDDDQGDLGDVRRRAAGRNAPIWAAGQPTGRARRLGDPDPLRRGRRRGRHRGGGVRLRPAVPLLSADLGLRGRPARPAHRRPGAPRGESCSTAIPRDRRKVYRMRPIVEAVVDQRLVLRNGPDVRPRRSSPASPGSTGCRSRSWRATRYFYGGCWTADACDKIIRFVDLAETFHLPIVYLCDCPGFHIGLEAEQRGDDPQGRARDGGGQPVERAVVHVSGAQRVRRRRRGQPALGPVFDPLCLAVGALGVAAAGRRDRGRLSRRDRRRPRTATPRSPRSRSASTCCARRSAPPRPSGSRRSSTRATRAGSLCEFANLAEKLREPGEHASACGRDREFRPPCLDWRHVWNRLYMTWMAGAIRPSKRGQGCWKSNARPI